MLDNSAEGTRGRRSCRHDSCVTAIGLVGVGLMLAGLTAIFFLSGRTGRIAVMVVVAATGVLVAAAVWALLSVGPDWT